MLFEGVPVLKSALDRIVHLEKCSRALSRSSLQIPLSLLLLLDAQLGWIGGSRRSQEGLPSTLFSYMESLLGVLLLTQGLLNAFSYFFPMFRREKIPLTAGQMTRLGLSKGSLGFKLLLNPSPSKTASGNPTFSPLEGSFILNKETSSANNSLNSSSWMFTPYSPHALLKTSSPASSASKETKEESRRDFKRSHFYHESSLNSSINDEKSLTEYLRDFSAWEKSSQSLLLSSGMPGKADTSTPGNSFWKSSPGSPSSPSGMDYSPILKKYSYQLASQPPPQPLKVVSSSSPEPSSSDASKNTTSPLREISSASRQLRVDPLRLVQMTENLRLWISQTVLSRVVQEIDSTNKALSRLGLSDCKIGEVGLEKIKKNSLFHFSNIPSLCTLVPFLEVSSHQEYLVGRLRELVKGGALGSYRWNAGGSYKGVEWSDKFVTDAEIIMHCVASYLDSRLPPNYDYIEGDGRAFSSVYYFEKPPEPKKIPSVGVAIVQSPQKPPYYYLQFKDKMLELEPGRNNLFHVLLMFMHHIKTKEDGMVGRINFGLSGVNILWVLDS
eukprot:TRINITY_DN14450_c0_g1_i1.p1 TRINITY_DN14450_c0_g1~~TRINITY_DN14450_c0_g1_i1.p1  ORF type:complete len:554 (-),score=177.95 TRINITY_DN14450_c0_g1_i1:108-1769(-)